MSTVPPAAVFVLLNDALQRDSIALTLRRNQMQPIFCETFDQARECFQASKPNAILIDLHLPGLNSLDLLRDLRRDGLLQHCAVVVLSSMGFPEVIRQAITAGADDFIVKPFDPDALIARLYRLIERKV